MAYEILDLARKSLKPYTDIQLICDDVIVCKHEDGMYSIYMPCKIDYDIGFFYDLKIGLSVVFTNVEAFIVKEFHANYIMLVKVKGNSASSGYWTFICPNYFMERLDQELCNKRIASLPKIYYSGESHAEFVEELDKNTCKNNVFIKINNDLFLVRFLPLVSSFADEARVSFIKLSGSVMTTNFDTLFKLSNNHVESLFKTIPSDTKDYETVFGPFYSISPMPEDFYPFLDDRYSGMIAKDKDGNICGIYIGCNFVEVTYCNSYSFVFDKKVTNLKFCKRISKGKLLSDLRHEIVIDVWKVEYLNSTEKLLFKITGGKQFSFELDYSDLI